MKIRIVLPEDRDFAGWLEVLDAGGTVVFKPVPAAGRAHDALAAAHGNASRNPLRPYGDTPLGGYAVRGIVHMDGNTRGVESEVDAGENVLWLEPETGQAALADAHGRFRFFIQGGGGDEVLHATAGGIRLRDCDHAQMVALVRRATGYIGCEIVTTDRTGARISLARIPAESDPPPLPNRPVVRMRPSNGVPNRVDVAGAALRGTNYAPRMFVAAEISGAGGDGTEYGGPGGIPGGDPSPPEEPTGTPDNPLPVTGVDVVPRPGVDLNLPPDQTIVRIMDTPGGLLFPGGTSASGYTPIVSGQAGGWVFSFGTQATDPSNTPGSTPYTPYTSNPVGPYSGGTPETTVTNQYTGTPPTEPFSNTVVPGSGGNQAGPAPVERDTLDHQDAQIQAMVERFAQSDKELAASQSAPSPQQTPNAQPAPPAATPAFIGPPPDPGSAISPPGTGAPQSSPQPGTTTSPNPSASTDPYPWGAAAAVGTVGSQPYVPGGVEAAPPRIDPPRIESAGAWERANPSETALNAIREQIAMGFRDPALGEPGAKVSTATASTEGTINRLIRGQTAEISAYDARLARGEVGVLAPKGVSLKGLDYATASRLPTGDYQINVGDTASRYTANPFKTSPGAAPPAWQAELAKAFGPNGSFSLPKDPVLEQAIRDAHNAGRVSPVQIDTVDFSATGKGQLSLNGIPLEDAAKKPSGVGEGGGGGLRSAAAGGAVVGGGVATAINVIDILAHPGAHPDIPRELATTAVLGSASGATGATIESAFARSLLSAAGGAEASGLESAVGRSFGGGLGGGPAAVFFTLGSMALSDKSYTTEDYEAKGARSLVVGGASGALAAGVVGAIWGSEVPILGNIVGFGVGFLGYLAFDALFGDEIEGAVRSEPNPVGDFEVVQDPSGFLT